MHLLKYFGFYLKIIKLLQLRLRFETLKIVILFSIPSWHFGFIFIHLFFRYIDSLDLRSNITRLKLLLCDFDFALIPCNKSLFQTSAEMNFGFYLCVKLVFVRVSHLVLYIFIIRSFKFSIIWSYRFVVTLVRYTCFECFANREVGCLIIAIMKRVARDSSRLAFSRDCWLLSKSESRARIIIVSMSCRVGRSLIVY